MNTSSGEALSIRIAPPRLLQAVAGAVAVDGDHLSHLSRDAANAASHGWAGIHFRRASDASFHLGRDVGNAVITWAESDCAD